MDQQQIDPIEPEIAQARLRRTFERARADIVAPDFGGDGHLLALEARCAKALPDGFLVGIHARSVDMAVAAGQRRLYRAHTGRVAQLPRAEAERGDAHVLRVDENLRAHARSIGRRAQMTCPAAPLGT